MACDLIGAKPLSQPLLEFCQLAIGNKFQWNLNRNLHIFIEENLFENIVRKLVAISLGLNVLRIFADEAFPITNYWNLQLSKERAKLFTKVYRWCLADKLSINKDKKVRMVQDLGLLVEKTAVLECLCWLCMYVPGWHYSNLQSCKTFCIKQYTTPVLFSTHLLTYQIWNIEVYDTCVDEHQYKL